MGNYLPAPMTATVPSVGWLILGILVNLPTVAIRDMDFWESPSFFWSLTRPIRVLVIEYYDYLGTLVADVSCQHRVEIGGTQPC